MSIRAAELRAQTRISAAFIAADPIEITLIRSARNPDGAGGAIDEEPLPVSPQTFRLLPQEDGATARTNRDGESATPEFLLMGLPDCNLHRFDEFTTPRGRFRILWVDNRQYEVKGEAIYLGN